MPFNTLYYFHRTLFYLTTPLIVVLLYFFGSTPEYFDLIYIGALGLSCVFCWKDKDTLGAILILLGFWCLSETIYFLPRSTISLILIYAASLGISIFCYKNHTAKFTLIIILFTIAVELFWFKTGYENKPLIYYYLGLLASLELVRDLLFKRVLILSKYFGYISGKIALDWQIRTILLAYYILVVLMLFEYFLRHLFGFHNVTFIYYSYSFVAAIISGITLGIIYMHYFYNQSQKHLPA